MSRSLKKGPYINVSLEKKILAMNESGKAVRTVKVLRTPVDQFGGHRGLIPREHPSAGRQELPRGSEPLTVFSGAR